MVKRRLIVIIAVLVMSVCAAGSASAFPRSSAAPASHSTVLRVLHAPIRWAAVQKGHPELASAKSSGTRTYNGTASLGGRTVLFQKTTKATGSGTSTSVTLGFPSGSLSGGVYTEQDYDALFSSNGTTVTETDYASGTLAYDDGSANFTIPPSGSVNPDDGPCGSSVTCSGLTYKFTDCLSGNWSDAHTYDCYHVYSASSSSRTTGYRAGWWQGSSNSESGYDLQSVVVRNGMAGCSDCGVQELSWSPASTRYLSSGTETTTLSMNLQVVSGSISQSLLIHSASYGPTPNYPTSTQFQFEWDGDVGYTDVIGVAGGEEWQFNLSHGYPLYNYVTLYIVNA
jgi:hypothetical protein